MVSATSRCRVCREPLTPGTRFCPHCGARVEDDFDDDAAMSRRAADEGSHRMWLPVAAIVAVVGIVAVVAIALASTSGGGGGNAPGTSVSPTPTTGAHPPATTSRPPPTRSPTSAPS